MTVGSLFAGIGGFDLAAERVWGPGCVRWQVEVEPYCLRVLAKHWPDVPRYGDIRELTGAELSAVDLVCGGFPCQPVSLAGQRAAQDDPRWLWPEMARVIAAVRPRWVVAENVPGLLRLGLDAVCADLEALGYAVGTLGIPAVAVGAPHLRERLWIVAHAERAERGAGERAGNGANGTAAVRQEAAGRAQSSGANGRGGALADASLRAGELLCRTRGDDDGARPGRAPNASNGGGGGGGDHWAVEPGMGRMADGVPARVDRLRALGNAVVPQVAEFVFRRIAGVAA